MSRKYDPRKVKECPACGVVKPMTRHHVMPKRFFSGKGKTELICRDCHDKLELYIPHSEIMPSDFYPMIFRWFCNKET